MTGSLEAITRRGLGLTRWPDEVLIKQRANAINRAIDDDKFMMNYFGFETNWERNLMIPIWNHLTN